MKTFRLLMLMLLAGSVIATSCKKDDNDDDNGNNNNNNNNNNTTFAMSTTIDGEDWGTNSMVAVINTNGDEVTITGVGDGNVNSLTITMASFSGVGTYQIVDANDNYAAYNIIGTTNVWYAPLGTTGTGVISVSKFENNVISGTFSFVGVNPLDGNSTKTFANGSFTDVTLTVQ